MPERGVMLQFPTGHALTEATRACQAGGGRVLDAFTPHPIKELDEILAARGMTAISWSVFLAGLCGAIGGFALQTWAALVRYRLQVGGMPLFSWPAFLPVTFECAVLCGALTAFFSVFVRCRLPRFHHPVWDHAAFRRASGDGFFLLAEAPSELLESLGGQRVS